MQDQAHGGDDLAWTAEWTRGLFDPDSRADRNILSLARGDWATYMRVKLALLEAEERLGLDFDEEHLRRPVEHAHAKREALAAYVQDGGRLNDAVAYFDWPWVDIARILSNGRPTPMIAWDEERTDDFEVDLRTGVSMRQLASRYGLTYAHARALTKLFRGTDT